MRPLILWILVGGCLVIGVLVGLSASTPPHDFADFCEQCHLNPPQAGEDLIFTYDIDFLCQQCHDQMPKNSHPSQIYPSMEIPEGLHLDWQGRITCTTCHDPHAQTPAMLRGEDKGKYFCAQCHRDLLDATNKHQMIDGIAHSKNWTPPTRDSLSSQLDQVSLDCISCHEGSIAQATSFQMGGEPDPLTGAISYRGSNFSHPIGMDYERVALGNAKLKQPGYLSPLISLYEGKVGCGSCHSPFSKERDMLVFSNNRSALCLECHLL